MPVGPPHLHTASAALMLALVLLAAGSAGAGESPAQTARAIAASCSEKRFSDVSSYLHSSLRRVWIDINYKVKDYCELLTRNYTLRDVRIVSEERAGDHAVVFLTYTFEGGTEREDRAVFIEERGAWRLAG